jgi:hypothetical protein
VNWSVLISLDGTTLIDGLTNNIDDSSEGLGTDGYQNGGADIADTLSSNETLSGIKGNGTDVVSTEMLGDLENKSVGAILNLKGIQNWGKLALELHIDDGTNNLGNFTLSSNLFRGSGESAYII